MEPVSSEDRVALREDDMPKARGRPESDASGETDILRFRAEFRAEISAMRQDLQFAVQILRAEMRAGDAEIRRYMRVLHEEVLSRIAAVHRR